MKKIFTTLCAALISLACYSQIDTAITWRTPVSGQPVKIITDRHLRAGLSLSIPYVASTTPSSNGIVSRAGYGFGLLSNSRLFVGLGGSAFAQYLPLSESDTRYIVNSSTLQASSTFNISGNGIVGGLLGVGTTPSGYKFDLMTASNGSQFMRVGRDGVAIADGFFTLTNSTGTAGVFSALFSSKTNVTTSPGLWMLGDVLSGMDSGTIPVVRFTARVNNGTVTTRPTFQWANHTSLDMTMFANGNLSLGSSTLGEKLSVTGKITASVAPTNPTDVVRKQELDLKANITDLNSFSNYTASGDGASTVITITHGLSGISGTSKVIVQPLNAASSGVMYATISSTQVTINYTVAPVLGTGNLSYSILIKP